MNSSTTASSRSPRRRGGAVRAEAASGSPDAASAAGRPRRLWVWGIRLVLLIALLALWQWYGTATGGLFVPSLTKTLSVFPELISSGVLGEALLMSNIALIIGYPLSVIIGLALGFLIGRNRVADRALSYWLDIAMVIPMVTVVPIVIVALGLSLGARVSVVMLFALPVIALNARAAVRVIQTHLVEMADSFAATRRQTWTAVILPAAMPMIFTGLGIGIGRAISGMIIIELILIPAGLGGLLLGFKSSFSAPELYAVTLVIVVQGVLLTSLARLVEKRITARIQGGRA